MDAQDRFPKIYAGPRKSGKTTRLLHRAQETGIPILCMNPYIKSSTEREARNLGLDNVRVITLQGLKHPFNARIKEVLVDEAHEMLEYLLGVKVKAATHTVYETEVLQHIPHEEAATFDPGTLKPVKGHNLTVGIEVDTTKLDEAISKAKHLEQLAEHIDTLTFRSVQALEKTFIYGSGNETPIGLFKPSGVDLSSKEDETALLTIEVKDMHSVPVVKYKGEEVQGNVEVSYEWKTRGCDNFGTHNAKVKYYDKEKKEVVTLEHERFLGD